MFFRQADFFLQFAKQRLFDRLALAHAALGKLPAATAGALAQKYLAAIAHQDDADIGSISLCVDPVAHDVMFYREPAGRTRRTLLRDNAP